MRKIVGLALSALVITPLSGIAAADSPASRANGVTPRTAALTFLGRYDSGSGETGAEIVAFDRLTKTMLVTNDVTNAIDVVSIAQPSNPTRIGRILLAPFGISVQSVAAHDGRGVAVMAGAKGIGVSDPTVLDPGAAVFFDIATRRVIGSVRTGALPDGVAWSDDGSTVVIANEGEPRCVTRRDRQPTTDPTLATNPAGSVTVVKIGSLVPRRFDVSVRQVGFRSFNDQMDALRAAGVRVGVWPGATVAQDLEPEYPTIAGNRAYVTLQENNAIATIDLDRGRVLAISPLGLKDHSLEENALDASDRDGSPSTFTQVQAPVVGMYMPDAIDTMTVGRRTYRVTANEGDGREYFANLENVDEIDDVEQDICFADEERLGDLALDPSVFPDSTVQDNDQLGRLTVTTEFPSLSGDAGYTQVAAYGGRSVSVWDARGRQVWDSGSFFEQMVHAADPGSWPSGADNAPWATDVYDSRSDNKGPEPEGLVLGTHRGRTFAFVGLERSGGVVVFDVTDPRAPEFQQWFRVDGDISPEGLTFVPAADAPGGRPLLLVAHEISGTTSVLRLRL